MMRVAMLAHSTNPRGGVVHAMSLSDAFAEVGVEAVLHAPDATGLGFFRASRGRSVAFPVAPAAPGFADMIEQRIGDYVAWFERPTSRVFDIYHAHDGISATALRLLKQRGLIDAYARTVHHLDDFADARVARWERQSIENADALFAVSRVWRDKLEAEFGRPVALSGNGVDLDRFRPEPDGREVALRARLGLDEGPVFLSLGGIEARKNALGLFRAFDDLLSAVPSAQLVIAGGATLLDHGAYQRTFRAELAERAAAGKRLRFAGPIADADMPALYRLADVVVAASFKEGFGLSVIEALATDKPVVVSNIEPFVSYLKPVEALWCDPLTPASIAAAMRAALLSSPGGRETAARFPWKTVADRHLPIYQRLSGLVHA